MHVKLVVDVGVKNGFATLSLRSQTPWALEVASTLFFTRPPTTQAGEKWVDMGMPGCDANIALPDGKEITDPLRIEGSQKEWTCIRDCS